MMCLSNLTCWIKDYWKIDINISRILKIMWIDLNKKLWSVKLSRRIYEEIKNAFFSLSNALEKSDVFV